MKHLTIIDRWTHAARCHLASNIEGETDIFEEDSIYLALRAKVPLEEEEQPVKHRRQSQRSQQQIQASGSSSSIGTETKGKKKRRSSLKQEYNDAGYCYEYCPNRGTQMIMCEDKDCGTEWVRAACVMSAVEN